jgi:hypothetical protein
MHSSHLVVLAAPHAVVVDKEEMLGWEDVGLPGPWLAEFLKKREVTSALESLLGCFVRERQVDLPAVSFAAQCCLRCHRFPPSPQAPETPAAPPVCVCVCVCVCVRVSFCTSLAFFPGYLKVVQEVVWRCGRLEIVDDEEGRAATDAFQKSCQGRDPVQLISGQLRKRERREQENKRTGRHE